MSKRGDSYLRTLLIHGARSVILHAQRTAENARRLARLLQRRNPNVAAVARANKNARVVWALLAHGREFRPDDDAAAMAAAYTGRRPNKLRMILIRRLIHPLLRRSRRDGTTGQTVVGKARSTSSARKRLRSQPAHPIRDRGSAARKVRRYGCNLSFAPSQTERLAIRGRPCTGWPRQLFESVLDHALPHVYAIKRRSQPIAERTRLRGRFYLHPSAPLPRVLMSPFLGA